MLPKEIRTGSWRRGRELHAVQAQAGGLGRHRAVATRRARARPRRRTARRTRRRPEARSSPPPRRRRPRSSPRRPPSRAPAPAARGRPAARCPRSAARAARPGASSGRSGASGSSRVLVRAAFLDRQLRLQVLALAVVDERAACRGGRTGSGPASPCCRRRAIPRGRGRAPPGTRTSSRSTARATVSRSRPNE